MRFGRGFGIVDYFVQFEHVIRRQAGVCEDSLHVVCMQPFPAIICPQPPIHVDIPTNNQLSTRRKKRCIDLNQDLAVQQSLDAGHESWPHVSQYHLHVASFLPPPSSPHRSSDPPASSLFTGQLLFRRDAVIGYQRYSQATKRRIGNRS